MNIKSDNIIGEVVAKDYRSAAVFQAYGIDFCCKGGRSIAEACEHKNIEPAELIEALQKSTTQAEDRSADYNSWPLDLLADYIEKKHHRYVESRIPEIMQFLNKVVSVHGERHPELEEIAQLFHDSAGVLTTHMKKEEFILFPFIRKMVKQKSAGEPIAAPPFGTIQNPIAMMNQEHDGEGERFRRIETLANHYAPPADACNTYRVTLAMLKEFEEDLHLHIHLENNILFPKAVEMEKSVLLVA